jgi:hypothetical protein
MTLKVIGAIYYQALRLKLKGSPTYEHTSPPPEKPVGPAGTSVGSEVIKG